MLQPSSSRSAKPASCERRQQAARGGRWQLGDAGELRRRHAAREALHGAQQRDGPGQRLGTRNAHIVSDGNRSVAACSSIATSTSATTRCGTCCPISTAPRPSSSSSRAPTGSACRRTPGTTRRAGCGRTPTTARRRPRARSSSARRSSGSATASSTRSTSRSGSSRRTRLRPSRSCPTRCSPPRLCRGYNDWLLADWLEHEPRLRGLLVVTPQHPEAAAAEIRRLGEREEIAGVFLPGAARDPVRQPGARSDLARMRRPRAPGRRAHPLRGRRHRRAGDRRRDAGLLHGVPRAHRRRRCSATSPRSSATGSSSASRARA